MHTQKIKFAKKTYLLPQKLINDTKNLLQAKTETEAIIRAMEEVTFRNELVQWHQKHQGKIEIEDIYE